MVSHESVCRRPVNLLCGVVQKMNARNICKIGFVIENTSKCSSRLGFKLRLSLRSRVATQRVTRCCFAASVCWQSILHSVFCILHLSALVCWHLLQSILHSAF